MFQLLWGLLTTLMMAPIPTSSVSEATRVAAWIRHSGFRAQVHDSNVYARAPWPIVVEAIQHSVDVTSTLPTCLTGP